jgi:DNA-binding protein H-NS
MKPADFSRLSVDELLSVREIINELLTSKIGEERRNLEMRIQTLNRFDPTAQPFSAGSPKSGKIPAKYQNPDDPSETWAGRGKTPRWLIAAIKRGKKREDFLIGADRGEKQPKRAVK